jgi:ferrous iron transport protein A
VEHPLHRRFERVIAISTRIVDPTMHNRPIPLDQLRTGQTARISRILGQPDHVHRLEEFGLRGGTCIEMFRRGNPCIIRMAGNKICFRADDGLSISVVPIPLGD